MKKTAIATAACAAMLLGILMPNASAEHDSRYDIVAKDRNGEPVKRYQLQHCGKDDDHRSHWYKLHGDHEHWCPGGPHHHH